MKESGKTQEFTTGAHRDSQEGKGRFDLIPTEAYFRLAKLYQAGAEKYGERNWEKGMPISRLVDSAIRHLIHYIDGDDIEDNLAAVLWNVSGIMYMEKHRPEMQDLPLRKKNDMSFFHKMLKGNRE